MRETPIMTTFDGSVWAFDAFVFGRSGQFPLYDENSSALAGFGEVRGTLARLSAYAYGSGAALPFSVIALWEQLPRR
jgi:hypothetical protein